jgi:single-strand DNA-binding protein
MKEGNHMKNITIAGTIGKDAATRDAGKSTVTGWSVAVDDGWGDNKKTLWFDCSLWGKRGEALERHLVKGGKVTVTGDLSTREYDGKTYMTVNANDVTLQGGKPQGQADSYQAPAPDINDDVAF